MPSKLQFYQDVAEQAAHDVASTRGNWTNFLDTAARLYKYSFPDQLLIHAQRPDAIACATMEMWNNEKNKHKDFYGVPWNRWVRRGTKGIALIDDSGSYPKLNYVFDVSDTVETYRNSRPIHIWEMRQEHKELVITALDKIYDDVSDDVADSFRNIAKQLAREYYDDNAREIRLRTEDSFLEELDDLNLEVAFENALTNSVAYTLMSRCGLDTTDYFDDEDFQYILDFNTPDMIYAIGTATNELSVQVLRDIEIVIKKYERQKAVERSVTNERSDNVHTGRGLSDAGYQAERAAEGADRSARSLREDEESVPQRASDDNVQSDVIERNAVLAPAGDRGSGEREIGTSDERTDGAEPAARQSDGPDGLDSGDEHNEIASERNDTARTDLRGLNTITAGAPSEQGGAQTYSQAENTLAETLSTSSITLDEVDSILRDGGNDKNSILRITAHFAKGLPHDEDAAFLRREYLIGRWSRDEEPGGKGYQFGTEQTSVWFNENGITIGRGKSALFATDSVLITWEQAAERVKQLYDSGQYVTHDVLDEALYNEVIDCACDVVDFYRDMFRGIGDIQRELRNFMTDEQKEVTEDSWRERRYLIRGLTELSDRVSEALNRKDLASQEEIMQLYNETIKLSEEMPQEWKLTSDIYESNEKIAELLRDKGEVSDGIGYNELSEYAIILRRVREDVAALQDEPDTPIRFWRSPHRVLRKLEKAGMPAKGFPAVEINSVNYMRFITDDEVDNFLSKGGRYSEGKLRMLSHFLHDHTPKERTNFIKREYGHGGGTWIDGGSWATPGKGITLQRPGCEDVKLNWNQTFRRTQVLIQSGRYASRAQLNQIPQYERIILARYINDFFYNLPDEYERPFDKSLNLQYPNDNEWAAIDALLGDPDKISALLGQMQYIYANTPKDDRYYDTRKMGYDCLLSYRDGTYTLFPGLENLPDPELAVTLPSLDTQTQSAQTATTSEPVDGQLSIFDISPAPVLPSPEEQRDKIEKAQEQTAEATAPAVSLPVAQDEIDERQLAVTEQAVTERKPTIYDEYLQLKADNPDDIVMFQIGDFFNYFNDDAETAARLLDIALTSREIDGHDERIKMAGVPSHSLSDYAEKLSDAGYSITLSSIEKDGSRSVSYIPLKEEQATELDFDAIAQTVLERVIQDTDYIQSLSEAKTRAELRNPVTWAIEQAIRDHEHDEPEIWKQFFSADTGLDFQNSLHKYILQETWVNRDTLIDKPTEQSVPDLDFDAIAQTVLERVMQDTEFTGVLRDAQNRTAIRNPLNTALETAVYEHQEDEPHVHHAYFNDDDFSDRLFDFVYHRAWELRPQEVIAEPSVPYTVSGIEHVQDIANYIEDDFLTEDTLETHSAFEPYEMFENVREELLARGISISGEVIEDVINQHNRTDNFNDIADLIQNEITPQMPEPSAQSVSATPVTPPPVFFVDWNAAKSDFNLSLYNDGDIVGYDKDGATHTYNRMGDTGFTSKEIHITPFGDILEQPDIPPDIRQQIAAYRNGELTDEQIRDNYLAVFEEIEQTEPPQEVHGLSYAVGDTVKLDGYTYVINDIADGEVQLRDIRSTDSATVLRNMNISDFEREYSQSLENAEAQAVEAIEPLLPRAAITNFRITDDYLGEGGAKTKFRYNMDAIHLLNDLEFDKRSATPEEQEVLSRYVGWGGIPQAFDQDNEQWKNEYFELLTTLSPDDYESAKGSTLNAHYTSPTVIKAMYETVERMGFQTGNILEPSCGVGNFFGLLPESMSQSKLYGVELDSVTARIAKQLYPNANIKHTGFERTDTPDAFFDLAIGNVPFGDYGVFDKRYNKHKFAIHDYFFAKTLDQVRPGGVIAFITSKYTLDKQNPNVRKYIAQRADMLGAVRLPNNAFLKNAGTETTMDIIFLQKRDRPMDIEPDWVHLGLTDDGIPVNRYYLDNPEMVLGKMALDERMNNKYGNDNMTACLPIEGADLAEQLKTALLNVNGEYTIEELDDLDGVDNQAIPADPLVKNFSYALISANIPLDALYQDEDYPLLPAGAVKIGEGQVYFRENSLMYPVELPATTLERIKGMIALRDCVHELINLQLDEFVGEETIRAKQAELNILYDEFTAEYGLINSTANDRAFRADSAYYLLSSLEILDEDGKLERKADMFTKRTIKQKTVITHVDTASEALAVSLGEKACVDIEYMSELTGKDEQTLFNELRGVIYADYVMNIHYSNNKFNHVKSFDGCVYRTADEFLSGNIRKKLKTYSEVLGSLSDDSPYLRNIRDNVDVLTKAMPKDLDASEIAVRLGSTWIEPQYIEQFMYELLNTSWHNRSIYKVNYHQLTGEWQITGKGRAQYSDIHATVTYGTKRMNAYQIIADTLNLRDMRVYDYIDGDDGKQKRVLNKKETTLAQQKQEQIKQAFKDWIWKDPERRQTLVQKYNETFNSVRPREYDGSHLTFPGMSPEVELRPHQTYAAARIMYGGNSLLAHVVGAGKTFTMIAPAVESKRVGLCNKSLFVVPNHLTDQWAGEFLRLYPSANILVATKKDFEMRNRKKFCAKIATGDYDAVIIGHSQLEKIPISRERQERHINDQIYDIERGIEQLKASKAENFSVKQLEKTKKSLEVKLEKLLDSKVRDDVVTFEQLGVDRLFIDESHYFKNLFLYTKMRNVAGLSTSEAQKSSDLFMKCRYMDELTGNKGNIHATGTPISNSMTEMYTVQRYLQYDTLVEKGLTHFDCWASIFGETQTSIELAPEGTGYRARTRFAKFHNLPELMTMFKEVADIQTADMLNLPVPEVKYENIIVEASELQKEMVQELSERASKVQRRLVDPRIDNMLKITTDGRKIGLDQRLMNPLLPDFEGSKVNACAGNVFRIWEETKNDKLTQLVFSDFSTPNKDGRFNIYDDIRDKLIERGIPEHELAFIHDADTETKKKELFAKVRSGRIRILFGSTAKMGAGTNVQDRLIATHDVDCPWRPADLEQRSGRIVRQGNKNDKVQIYRYATSGTFDSYLWQTVESKQKFIAQIMSSKSPVRSCEDVDETALSYAEIKALCAGNPLIAEKMNLDVEVAKLRMLKSDYNSQRYRLEDDLLKRYPERITAVTEQISGLEKDIEAYTEQRAKLTGTQTGIDGAAVSATTAAFAGMTINGVTYAEKEPAAKALLEACKSVADKTDVPIGSYMGFDMSLRFDSFNTSFKLLLRGAITHQTELGTDAFGNITRINNTLEGMPKRLEGEKSQLESLLSQQEAAKQELEKPFTLTDELAEKEARLALLNAELNIDGDGGLDVLNDTDSRDESMDEIELIDDDEEPASVKSEKPSFLDKIHAYNTGNQQSSTALPRAAGLEI